MTTIEIEQISADNWVARLETGSLTSRSGIYRATALRPLMDEVERGYYELAGISPPAPLRDTRKGHDR
jgi:hypothetical protein